MRAGLIAGALAVAVAMPGMATAATLHVAIKGYAFVPARIAVHPGDTVVWTNDDGVAHTVTALDGSFASPALATGATFRHRFTAPGTIRYHCAIHPEMQASVLVAPPG